MNCSLGIKPVLDGRVNMDFLFGKLGPIGFITEAISDILNDM